MELRVFSKSGSRSFRALLRGIFSAPFSEACERVDEFLAEQVGELPEPSFDENGVTRMFLLAAFSRLFTRYSQPAASP